MNSLRSKISIVTGASRGIGAGIAKAFGAAGASVVVNYAGNPDGAARTVAAIVADAERAATEGLRDVGLSEEMERHVVAQTPLGRFGLPEDMARIAVFLASDHAAFVTGERVMGSGGWR
jgi:3-oxoacyl-[acyl-carrier protein] reductase